MGVNHLFSDNFVSYLAGHSQMNQEHASVSGDHRHLLAAAVKFFDAGADQKMFREYTPTRRQSQNIAPMQSRGEHRAPDDKGLKATAERLDFGEFGHSPVYVQHTKLCNT